VQAREVACPSAVAHLDRALDERDQGVQALLNEGHGIHGTLRECAAYDNGSPSENEQKFSPSIRRTTIVASMKLLE